MTDSLKKALHSLRSISYEKALVLLVLIHLVFFAPIFQGKVILPNNNRFIDAGLPGYCEVYSSNGYGDTVTYFLPNIDSQLSSNSLNWIPTWMPEVEFGRPFTFSSATRGFLVTNL